MALSKEMQKARNMTAEHAREQRIILLRDTKVDEADKLACFIRDSKSSSWNNIRLTAQRLESDLTTSIHRYQGALDQLRHGVKNPGDCSSLNYSCGLLQGAGEAVMEKLGKLRQLFETMTMLQEMPVDEGV